jgi:hypothetical protein
MSTLMQQVLQSDAELFVDPDSSFGEIVQYWPRPCVDPTTKRTINAIIIRDPPQHQLGTDTDVRPHMELYVINDNVKGISSAELNVGGDKICVALRIGGPIGVHPIGLAKTETNDVGMLHLEI